LYTEGDEVYLFGAESCRVPCLLEDEMKVVILCGGQGTRIRDVSELLPKPMLPVGGRPVVWHIMKGYAAHGFREFVLCLGYKGWTIKEFFLNYGAMMCDVTVNLGDHRSVKLHRQHDEDWLVTLADTGENTMTGGRVAAIRSYLGDDDLFLLTYGDGVADIDLTALVEFHRRHGKVATLTAVRPQGRFGELGIDGSHVYEFNEKPQATGGFINGGFFVFDAKRLWNYFRGGSEEVLETGPLRRLAADGQLEAFAHTGFWQPMDTFREYSLLNEIWANGKAPWKIWNGPP
jgi:glucose-1-phosphate cytidylyltransferase